MADDDRLDRRAALKLGAAAAAIGGVAAAAGLRGRARRWQIDPDKCVWCGGCASNCVLTPSAVRCLHSYDRCGYCELCFGYFEPQATQLDEGAENQLCPTGALERVFVEGPYYEYHVDRERCIGCARCVAGCTSFGNGSLFLQIDHEICVQCNRCRIADHCPAQAIALVDADQPYYRSGEER